MVVVMMLLVMMVMLLMVVVMVMALQTEQKACTVRTYCSRVVDDFIAGSRSQ